MCFFQICYKSAKQAGFCELCMHEPMPANTNKSTVITILACPVSLKMQSNSNLTLFKQVMKCYKWHTNIKELLLCSRILSQITNEAIDKKLWDKRSYWQKNYGTNISCDNSAKAAGFTLRDSYVIVNAFTLSWDFAQAIEFSWRMRLGWGGSKVAVGGRAAA